MIWFDFFRSITFLSYLKISIMKKILLFIATIIVTFSANAQQGVQFPYEEMGKTATTYFEAYRNLDADGMAAVYADDIQYIDETLAGYGGKTFNASSKDEVIKNFKENFFPSAKKFDWQEESRFFSGNQGVFRGTLVVHYKGSVNGKSDDITYLWSVPYVSILTFKDGKIARHNDYVNYPVATFTEKK